jgi:hypothetical protein
LLRKTNDRIITKFNNNTEHWLIATLALALIPASSWSRIGRPKLMLALAPLETANRSNCPAAAPRAALAMCRTSMPPKV